VKFPALLLMALFSPALFAQQVVLKGVVRNRQGEKLPLAHVRIDPDSVLLMTGEDARFSTVIPKGRKRITISYVGYENFSQRIFVRRDTTISLEMVDKVNALDEVVVTGKRNIQEEIFESNRTSTHVLTKDIINAIPVLGGEADVIKTLQLLPGTIRGVEGSSDLFVRGGAADQNLVLLDDVPIYNTSHLFGFLSIFNPDILDKVEAINGGFPAQYGGRLSSILNVQTISDIPDQTHGSADIGLIATRLFIEQPIIKNKASVWVAARRTYIDQVVKVMGEELPYFFYDLNGKLTITPTTRDLVTLSFYSGDDKLDLFRDRNNDGNGFLTRYESGNNSQSLRWVRTMRNNWTRAISLIRSKYRYTITNAFDENKLIAVSDIEDYGARVVFQNDSLLKNISVKAGVDWTGHNVSPNVINTAGVISELLASSSSRGRIANEVAAYGHLDWNVADRWQLSAGLRASMTFVENKNYFYPEPRFAARYKVSESQAIKFSYSRMVQYIHRISNSAISSPTDIWYPVTDRIRPQTSHQIALAWNQTFDDKKIFLSIEGYYKSMNHLIGYEEGTNLFLNNDFEPRLIQGKGEAYGVEALLRKDVGRLTGWLSYTLSWSSRQFNEINNGSWFPSRYDRRHNGALVVQYALGKRWAISSVWEFVSGARFTPVVGQYVLFAPTLTGVDLIPVYSGINQVKLADTHRLDLGLKFKSKSEKKYPWQIFAGVYNLYNRANPLGIIISQDEQTGELRYEQPGLFGLIPFISYGRKF
jgi:hypothetical protein